MKLKVLHPLVILALTSWIRYWVGYSPQTKRYNAAAADLNVIDGDVYGIH